MGGHPAGARPLHTTQAVCRVTEQAPPSANRRVRIRELRLCRPWPSEAPGSQPPLPDSGTRRKGRLGPPAHWARTSGSPQRHTSTYRCLLLREGPGRSRDSKPGGTERGAPLGSAGAPQPRPAGKASSSRAPLASFILMSAPCWSNTDPPPPQPAGCQLPPPQLSSKSPFGERGWGTASQSEGRRTRCIPAQGLQRQGCLIKDELHFHQRIEKIDSQGCIVIIWFLKKRGWHRGWGWAGHSATWAISDETARRSSTIKLGEQN